ncbi:DUF3122 domain-containing protein (plasmid) [Acaryochloris sp. 'Moss Beach']|uniref:DUF3122 domain-containing protein n=1 Tax=Acaryochloris marina TaxID=155978 RepID=UPI001BAEBD66|nr:DUF3122 domain-containing protein [Acaryochloris marina]QUY46079.1 DUF3122 domain-containing protein [Acaryochloris marina S15]UJB72590.1 DUF3122 domain-containing protein [Acaryochloris sp. 'Moss Beach']
MRVWIRRGLFLLLLISTLVLLLVTNMGNGIGSSAIAEVSMTRESQGQMLYQSRQHLPDQQGNHWLVVASKHVGFASPPSIDLMLAGCPGFVDIDHSLPLTLIMSKGKTVKVKSLPESLYTEVLPGSNVAQYNLQPIVPELDAALDLFIPTKGMKSIQVEVPTQVVQEWQTVATCADILCEPLTDPALPH